MFMLDKMHMFSNCFGIPLKKVENGQPATITNVFIFTFTILKLYINLQ